MKKLILVIAIFAFPIAARACPPVDDGGGSFSVGGYGAGACGAPAASFAAPAYGYGSAMVAAPSYHVRSFAAPVAAYGYSAPVVAAPVAYGGFGGFRGGYRAGFGAPVYGGFGGFRGSFRGGYGVAAPVIAVPVRAPGPIRGAIQGFRSGLRNRLNGF